jgi:hypothetical protein
MSYMAAMGGWGVLDYAENFAPDPFGWLQLGYASYLSSWALMNTGPAENNYGFWFPGPENDGASGWQFTSTKTGSAWMGSSFPGGVSEPRGPWHYDGEIDLGYGGAFRMAATIDERPDSAGAWRVDDGLGATLSVNPRDGLRRRLDVVIPDRYLPFAEDIARPVEVERDACGRRPITVIGPARIDFTVENRTNSTHTTGIRQSLPVNSITSCDRTGKSGAHPDRQPGLSVAGGDQIGGRE